MTRSFRPSCGAPPWGVILAFFVACAAAVSVLASPTAAERIEKIVVQGNEFMSQEAVVALTDLNVGDMADDKALNREWHKIYDSGLFADVLMSVAQGDHGGQVVIIRVVEKPRIDSVHYETIKALTQTKVDEVLKENDAQITSGQTFDQDRVSKTKKILEDMLAVEGYPEARVTVVQRHVGRSRVSLDFKIDQGPKLKIAQIAFTGNTVFTEHQLKGMLRQTAEQGLFHAWSSKTVFYRPRFEDDLKEVTDAYRAKGYIDVDVGEPVVRDFRPGKSGKEERRLVTLVVPITEGSQYRLGKLAVTGNSIFATKDLRGLIPVGEGEILNDSLLKLGCTRIDNHYGDQGYYYAASSPRYYPDTTRHTCDVEVQVTENDQYTIHKIEFVGNVHTRDEVLRRELRLSEGDVFSRRDFQVGMRKIAQLGFWKLDGEPVIKKADTGKHELDITVKGKEADRNEIQFGGGFSGVDGFFATFSFSSRNFLGRGAELAVSGQLGGRNTRYSLVYTEPYIWHTRGTLGEALYARDQTYSGFSSRGKGASIFWSHPTSTFSAVRTTGRWEDSHVVNSSAAHNSEFVTYSLSPSFIFDDRDNPFRPSRGRRFTGEVEVGASRDLRPTYPHDFQDGTVSFVKPGLSFTQYFRTHGTQYVGIHVEGGGIEPFGTRAGKDPYPDDGISTPYLPVFERFFLGGENSIRGVGIRSVGPHLIHMRGGAEINDVAVGGNEYYLANLEYTFPLGSIFELATFLDMGNTWGVENVDPKSILNLVNGDKIRIEDSDPANVKGTAGVELRFHTPVLQQPLRLIYGCKLFGDFLDNNSTCDFQFSIGRTFQ